MSPPTPIPIIFSKHARETMGQRGAEEAEVVDAIRTGTREPAKRSKFGYRKDFQYNRTWAGRLYTTKQVLAIVAEEPDAFTVVTVYTFYF